MRISISFIAIAAFGAGALVTANAGDKNKLIESAASAGPASLTEGATIKDNKGNVLREGSNGFTCYPGSKEIGPMCNDAHWEALLAALKAKAPYEPAGFGVSYMLAGEGDAAGVSNTDPFASEPADENDWVKEGPHMMLIMPDAAMLEGLSTDPRDAVYVMWKGTPYAHVMVRIAEAE